MYKNCLSKHSIIKHITPFISCNMLESCLNVSVIGHEYMNIRQENSSLQLARLMINLVYCIYLFENNNQCLGSVAAARKNDLDWITKTIDVIVCFVLCFVFIVFGGGYQTNWSKSYESCYMTQCL